MKVRHGESPLLVDNEFVVKRNGNEVFTECFCEHCKPITNDSLPPHLSYHIDERVENIETCENDMISLNRGLNVNKCSALHGISPFSHHLPQ